MSSKKPTRITVTPRGPRAPIGRLASVKPSGATSIKRPGSGSIGRPQAPRPTTHPKTTNCPNPGCPAPHIVDDDGSKVCTGCGTVISESNIVSEVTFGESSSGAAVVQGTFVGEGQTHTRSFGPGFQRGGGMESREMTEAAGNTYINQCSRRLNIPESASKAAGQVFKLAAGLNFIQGRRIKTVAAVCLYIACRRQAGNTIMLIDFADILMINVFKLGRTYKALLDELRIGGNIFMMNPIDPESLIYRFAKQLEFGSSTMSVAGEAVRIVQRMNRDWMSTGRRPAGLCGAALILAARMNNFRRTVREVVYVVKVTEITISQRLLEFGSTESGELTVDQFRSVQLENSHDPPSFTRAREGRKPSKAVPRLPETAAELEDDLISEPESTQARRVDADGFAIPDLPIDPALMEPIPRRSSIGESKQEMVDLKGKGRSRQALLQPSAEQIASEESMENEMNAWLEKGSDMIDTAMLQPKKHISSSTDIDESEFLDDPEVSNCLLSPAEVEIKERIWVTDNKEYLREQQSRALKRALEEATGGESTRKPRKRRKGRLGDVTYLEGEEADGSSRASTPAEATRRMLEVRGYSKKINYSMLDALYGGGSAKKDEETKDEDEIRDRSRSASVVSRRSLPPAATPSRRRRPRIAASKNHTPAGRAPQPTPPPTAPSGTAETVVEEKQPQDADVDVEIDEPIPEGPDPDEIHDDYADDDEDDEDDHIEEAFAGQYGDDYYDVGSDDDYQ